jgi:hypothetical protein
MEPEHEYHVVELNGFPPGLYWELYGMFGMPDDFTTTLFKRRWFIRGMKLHFYDERDHLMFLLKYGT